MLLAKIPHCVDPFDRFGRSFVWRRWRGLWEDLPIQGQ